MNPDLFKRTGAADFPRYLKCLVAGPPKSGKTSLLGTMPGILVLDTEPFANNLQSLAHLNVMSYPIHNSEDLRDIALILANESLRKQLARERFNTDDIYAVAIDTADSLQKIIKRERMADQKSSQFLRDDWGWLKTEMESIIRMFTALPMHVVFTVHLKTQEIGKGDDSWTAVLPGLEGGIAGDIAGMVGYSVLTFRKEEIAPDGTPFMKYWLRTEADASHDFLGTRVNGVKLPTTIEPNFKVIYDAVMSSIAASSAQPAPQAPPLVQAPTVNVQAPTVESIREGVQAAQQQVADVRAEDHVVENVAQTASQPEAQSGQVQTPVETPEGSGADPHALAQAAPPAGPPAAPPAERPTDGDPINPLAMTHVKRVYDSLQVTFPQDIVESLTMGQAREMVSVFKAIQQDHMEGKNAEGTTPVGEMTDYLTSMGWLPAPGTEPAPEPAKEEEVEPSATGTMPQVKAYIGTPPNLERVQEVYDLELQREAPRKTLIERLEGLGAKPTQPTPQPTEEVQTPVETPSEPVTQEVADVDTPATDEGTSEPSTDQVVETLQESLGATVISTEVAKDAKCDVCGKPLDDPDLAEVGRRRFGKLLCVDDYVALSEGQPVSSTN